MDFGFYCTVGLPNNQYRTEIRIPYGELAARSWICCTNTVYGTLKDADGGSRRKFGTETVYDRRKVVRTSSLLSKKKVTKIAKQKEGRGRAQSHPKEFSPCLRGTVSGAMVPHVVVSCKLRTGDPTPRL